MPRTVSDLISALLKLERGSIRPLYTMISLFLAAWIAMHGQDVPTWLIALTSASSGYYFASRPNRSNDKE